MDKSPWDFPRNPYDLRERLFEFACVVVRVVQFLHTRGPVGAAISYHLLKCGTSAGANYEEADNGPSGRLTCGSAALERERVGRLDSGPATTAR